MNRDDIIRMAREAGIVWGDHTVVGSRENLLERFAALVAELIVKECCFVGEQYADGLFDSKQYAFVNKKIKEHFGVLE
jgi:hypothetical protein